MKIKRIFLVIALILLLSLIIPTAQAVTPIPIIVDVNIPDSALNHALHDYLGKAYFEPISSFDLYSITGTLNFSEKGIKDLTGLRYCKQVDRFIFFDNEIKELPEAFCQMVVGEGVTGLHFMMNELSSLPSVLKDSSLKDLTLSLNKFYSIPSWITEISTLQTLIFSGNRISSIPSGIADMPNLDSFYIHGNRLTSIPGSFENMTLEEFGCLYNFIDFSPGSENKNILDSMNITFMLTYSSQLEKLKGLAVEYPDTGILRFSWEPGSDMQFGSITAKFVRITILQDGEYIDNITPDKVEYIIEGLEIGQEYAFSFSFDYKIINTILENHYVRSYTNIKATPTELVEETPTPEPTQEPTPEITQELATESDTPETDIDPIVTDLQGIVELEEDEDNSNGMSTWLIILIVVIAILAAAIAVLATLYIKKKK